MNDLAWLTLQLEWGADEALADLPVDRRVVRPVASAAPPAVKVTASIGPAGVAQAQALAQAAGDVTALKAALASFEGCALRATATNLVFAGGDADSRLVLIAGRSGRGRRPGRDPVCRPGRPVPRPHVPVRRAGPGRLVRHEPAPLGGHPGGPKADRVGDTALPPLPLPPSAVAAAGSGRAPRRTGGSSPAPRWAPVPGASGTTWWSPGCHVTFQPWHCRHRPISRLRPPAKRDAWATLLRLRRALDTDNIDH